jgi:hypothetical protein
MLFAKAHSNNRARRVGKEMKDIQNQGVKLVGNFFIVLSLVALAYSIKTFSDTHPLHAAFLTLDSGVFLLCAIGLRHLWKWTVYVFTLFWINAAITYYLTLQAGLEPEPVYVAVIVVILAVYYLTVFRNWKQFKATMHNQALRP